MTSTVKTTVNTYWQNRADAYDTSPGHDVTDPAMIARWRDLLTAELGAGPLDCVDVGCGTGFLALHLAALGHRVTGVDASPAMLALATSKSSDQDRTVTLLEGDADRLPVTDASADAVVERHVLWTMADPAVSLAEWARVLRPGGTLLLVEGDWRDRMTEQQLGDADPEFLRDYAAVKADLPLYGGRPAEVITDLVRAAGLLEVTSRELPEADLWPDAVDRPGGRYLVRGRKPA